jgi:hypothetical protein
MGTLATIPSELANIQEGFYDPNGKYPEVIDEPDVNRLSRNDSDKPHDVLASKESGRTTNVTMANGGVWSEPTSAYNATYPYNHVKETESGHIKEFDDTADNERIHEYHKSGTFYEVQPDGTKVTRVVGENYMIVAKGNDVNIKGNCNLTIDQNCTTYIKGDWDILVGGNKRETVQGTVTEEYAKTQNTTAGGDITIVGGPNINLNP